MAIFATVLGVLFCIVVYLVICVTIGYVLYLVEMYKMEKRNRKVIQKSI